MTQDFSLGFRMLLKYPGLTLAGGLALTIAIGVGAGLYQVWGNILSPTIPLPEGDRLVLVQTRNTLANQAESRVAHDFLEWQRELHTIEELGAYRAAISTLIIGRAPPMVIRTAAMTPVDWSSFRLVHARRTAAAGDHFFVATHVPVPANTPLNSTSPVIRRADSMVAR